jgi:hypothetical protein
MPKGMIPYEKPSFHKEYVARQAVNDANGASTKVPPHDDLEQAKQNSLTSSFCYGLNNSYINGWA